MSRKNFEMTKDDLNSILNACKSVPLIALQCGNPRSPQERANSAWETLGKQMGFDYMTVRPTGKGDRYFSAMVIEDNEGKL